MRRYLRFLPLGIFALPLLLLLQPVRGATLGWFRPTLVDAGHDLRQATPSMALIDGAPALAYVDMGGGAYSMMYHAANAGGASFADPALIYYDTAPISGVSLAEVAGAPMVAFALGDRLAVVRANDREGHNWQYPKTLITSPGSPVVRPQLFVIDGAPAIFYQFRARNESEPSLWYLRARDAAGATWYPPVRVPFGDDIDWFYSIAIVNGLPGVLYNDDGLKYARALDSAGGHWAAPVEIEAEYGEDASDAALVSLDISGAGRPVAAFTVRRDDYYQSPPDVNELYYIEALDKNGTTWGADKLLLEFDESAGAVVALDTDAGPTICYVSATLSCLTSGGDAPVDLGPGRVPFGVVAAGGMPALGSSSYAGIQVQRAADAQGAAWEPAIDLAWNLSVGYPSALSEVEGLPAVGYYREETGDLLYAQGRDERGTAWAEPVVVDSEDDVGRYQSLAVVDGHPAMSYFDAENIRLKYVRALDPAGDTWGEPVVVDAGGEVGRDNFLMIAGGRPLIGYYSNTDEAPKIVQAADPRGDAWNAPSAVAPLGEGYDYSDTFSFAVVDGRPAIALRTSGTELAYPALMYAQALDATGQTWDAPVIIDIGQSGGELSLREIAGRPAVAYYKDRALKFMRAEDAAGHQWGEPATVAGGLDTFWSLHTIRLLEVDGKPAIIYRDGGFIYVEATDETGASWGAAESSGALTGSYNFAAVVGGCPALSYYDRPDLRFMQFNCAGVPVAGATVYVPVLSK